MTKDVLIILSVILSIFACAGVAYLYTHRDTSALDVQIGGYKDSTVATSTRDFGWDIAAGCYAINGSCLSFSNLSGALTVNSKATSTMLLGGLQVLGIQTNYIVATGTASSSYAGGVIISNGGLRLSNLNCSASTQKLFTSANGGVVCGTDQTGLSAYDAWTHPVAGTSATTSIISITGSLSLDTNGVSFDTDGDGRLCITGASTGSDESLCMNLDDTSNEITFQTDSAATTLNWSAFSTSTINLGIGIATTSPKAALSLGSPSSILVQESVLATSTSMTVDWLNGNQQLIRLGSAATTITFRNYYPGMTMKIITCSPLTTAGAVTFAPNILWSGGSMPSQTTTARKCDVWSLLATIATSTNASGGTVKIFGAQTPNF